MGVVMQVVSTGGGKGAAGLSRYIAEKDRDPEREGKDPRPLFNDERADMTYRQADRVLGQGETAPEKDDLIHFVISLRPSDFERLGETDQERKAQLIEAVREAMQGVSKDLSVKDIDWIAGIHLNEDNPHVHIGMNKNMTDLETGELRRVETIPWSLRGDPEQRPEQGQNGQPGEPDAGKESPKKVSERFNEALAKRQEPITWVGFRVHDKEMLFRRELVPEGREPNPKEITVGRWIMLEIDPTAHGDGAREKRRDHLRDEVRRIDRESRIDGVIFVAAHIPQKELEEAIAKGHLTPLRGDQTQHRPFQPNKEQEQERERAEERDPTLKDRTILGKELAARLRVMHLSRMVEMAEQQGVTRGYVVTDASLNVERRLSVADLEGRANARSGRLARETEVKTGSERVDSRRGFYRREMAANTPALQSIEEQHAAQVQALHGMLEKGLDQHDRLLSQASRIEASYRAEGRDAPAPIIERRTLERLHEQAVDRSDVQRLNELESLRVRLADEFGGERRDDHAAARLFAQHDVAQQDARVSGKRVENFDRTSHLRKFEINGEKLSLSDVERDSRNKEREAKYQERRAEFYEGRLSLFPKIQNPISLQSFNPVTRIQTAFTTNPFSGIGQLPFGPTINPLKRAEFRQEAETARQAAEAARAEIERLAAIRTEVQREIESHRAQLASQHEQDKQVADTLGQMRAGELSDRAARGASAPEAQYTRWELRRMETNAGQLRDGQMLRDYERLATGEGIDTERMAARAFGREIAAEVGARGAQERLENFIENRDRTSVKFTDKDGEERSGSLRDYSPRSLLDRAIERVIGPGEDAAFNREAISEALAGQQQQLTEERDGTRDYYETAKDIAEGYRAELRALEKDMPQPEFTRQEVASIERYAVQLPNEAQREQLTELVRNSIEESRIDNHPMNQSQSPGDRADFKPSNEPEQSWKGPEAPGQSNSPDLNPANPSHDPNGGAGPDAGGSTGASAAPEAEITIEMPAVIIP